MVKPGALVMGVVMGAVSAGTYYGLELLPPGTIPPPIGRVVAEAEAPAPAKPAPVVAAAPAEPAAAPAASREPEVTEQDLAEEPPPPEAAPVQDEPDTAPAAAAPEPTPAPVEPPVEKPAPKVAEKPAAPAPAPRKAEAAPIKPWWPDPATVPDSQLKLMYAGQVKGQPAIALLFSAPVSLDSVKAHVRVATTAGTAVGGAWEVGKNPRLAVFKSVAPGRYTVILRPQVADAQGVALGTLLSGPVDIKVP